MQKKEVYMCDCEQIPKCCELLKCHGISNISTPTRELIRNTIIKFRKINKSYEEIGKRLKLTAGQVYKLENNQWYPKTAELEARILWELKGGGENDKQ